MADLTKPVVDPDFHHVYHIFNILHPKRDELKQYLLENGIGTEIHYPVAPQNQAALKEHLTKFDYPISTHIHENTLSLPCSFAHSTEDIYQVIKVLNKFNS